jgi:hypothetical protein
VFIGSAVLVLLTGGASCLRIFLVAVGSHASGEEIHETHDGLDLATLDATLEVTQRKQLGLSAADP